MVSSKGLVVGFWREKGVVGEEEMDKEEERGGRKIIEKKILLVEVFELLLVS